MSKYQLFLPVKSDKHFSLYNRVNFNVLKKETNLYIVSADDVTFMSYGVFYSEEINLIFSGLDALLAFSGELLDSGFINLFGPTRHTAVQ